MINFPKEIKQSQQLEFDLPEIVDCLLREAPTQQVPFFIHMLGVPGSGKTSFAKLLLPKLARLPAYVGFDEIMTSMAAYNDKKDPLKSFEKFELPAREAGYSLIAALLEKRADIFFDHGGSPKDHPDILRYARDILGYKIFVIHMDVPSDCAKQRVTERTQKGARYTPPEYVDVRYTAIESLKNSYERVSHHVFHICNDSEKNLDYLEQSIVPEVSKTMRDYL